jgi:hypothetical protein
LAKKKKFNDLYDVCNKIKKKRKSSNQTLNSVNNITLDLILETNIARYLNTNISSSSSIDNNI